MNTSRRGVNKIYGRRSDILVCLCCVAPDYTCLPNFDVALIVSAQTSAFSTNVLRLLICLIKTVLKKIVNLLVFLLMLYTYFEQWKNFLEEIFTG